MKWIKASERKSDHRKIVCCKKDGHWFEALYDNSVDMYIHNNGYSSNRRIPISEIEWLDESAPPPPVQSEAEIERLKELIKKAFFGTLGVQEEPFRNNYTWEEFMFNNGIYPNKPLVQSVQSDSGVEANHQPMTKQQLIRLILDAAATGKIEDAEKAIDEYVEELQ